MEGSIRSLRTDMQRLNDLIAKNGSLQSELAEENLFLETEFMGQLRVCISLIIFVWNQEARNLSHSFQEMEREAILLEEKLESSRKEKEKLMQTILDAE
jgi:hypothetical protein